MALAVKRYQQTVYFVLNVVLVKTCPEQEGFTAPSAVGLSGQEVTGGRSFGVVSGEAIRHQREMSVTDPNAVSPELMRQIAQSMQNQQNIPPVGNFPPQGFQNTLDQQNNLNQQMPMNNLEISHHQMFKM